MIVKMDSEGNLMFNNALIEVLGLDVRAVVLKHLIWFGATCHEPITLCLLNLIVNLFARMKPS